jgi:hypothetical protein
MMRVIMLALIGVTLGLGGATFAVLVRSAAALELEGDAVLEGDTSAVALEADGVVAEEAVETVRAEAPAAAPEFGAPAAAGEPAAEIEPDGSERLARIFGAMKPADAARVLEKLRDTDARAILRHMADRKAAAILGHFDAARAAALSRSVIVQGSI